MCDMLVNIRGAEFRARCQSYVPTLASWPHAHLLVVQVLVERSFTCTLGMATTFVVLAI